MAYARSTTSCASPRLNCTATDHGEESCATNGRGDGSVRAGGDGSDYGLGGDGLGRTRSRTSCGASTTSTSTTAASTSSCLEDG